MISYNTISAADDQVNPATPASGSRIRASNGMKRKHPSNVARLTLLPKSQLSAAAGEEVYFDVTGNSTPDSTPLGSINRARWPAEVASRKARMGR
jgi:hypothetical protein